MERETEFGGGVQVLFLVGMMVGTIWVGRHADGRERALPWHLDRLVPLHQRLGPPKPGEWLAEHKEAGQTYRQYVAGRPIRPDRNRRTIYVQPLGEFSTAQRRIVDLTAKFLGIYYVLPVKVQARLTLSIIPPEARRTHPTWGDQQILSTYVLEHVLKPRLPDDACVEIALTNADLWPGKGWNFVFGQASLRDRVGVWSLYRHGDPAAGGEAFRTCLLRTLKTATHETGHMFSMAHCTLYECNMCGSNSRSEADRRPLLLCPECLAKLCYAMDADPEARFVKLIQFCRDHQLVAQQTAYQASLDALRQEPAHQ